MRAILLAVALSASTLAVSAPALASGAETCAVAPAKLRALSASADAEAARKAERNIALGEALCDARNRSEATKKFNLAAKALGTELAAVLGTETASVQ